MKTSKATQDVKVEYIPSIFEMALDGNQLAKAINKGLPANKAVKGVWVATNPKGDIVIADDSEEGLMELINKL